MQTPVITLHGVGKRANEQFYKLGIETVEDLLFYSPSRYEDRTQVQMIARLEAGTHAVIEAEITYSGMKKTKKGKQMWNMMLEDGTGSLIVRFFHFNHAQMRQLREGLKIRCFAEVRQGHDCFEFIHPEYKIIPEFSKQNIGKKLTPVYLGTGSIRQKQWISFVEQALTYPLLDFLPDELRDKFNLPNLSEALHTLHFPCATENSDQLEQGIHPIQQRLALEELLAHHLSLRVSRDRTQAQTAPILPLSTDLSPRLQQALPFRLTHAQQQVISEISADLQRSHPMQRLLQGDVGSGKTIVAVLSALQAVEAGYQVALMTPIELLAEQHFATLHTWLTPLNCCVVNLTGSVTKKQRTESLAKIASGEAAVVVGTHALFQDEVKFNNLGFIIIDEQHRFGVHQRLALRNKGVEGCISPHQLIMTATPIPRTLAMTAYADLDVSIINQLPAGRTPIITVVMNNSHREEIIARIRHVCSTGQQVYWVCPLIEESDSLQLQAAENAFEQLQQSIPELNIGLVHGRMRAKNKHEVMAEFKAGKMHILVATTVIEVGVDVPNASLMIIENAERLGLAQLHQLRGRVGRGVKQSYCVLLYQSPLTDLTRNRLSILRETTDGFLIAQKDLDIRGAGEIVGTKQTGALHLRIADFQRDKALFDSLIPELAKQLLTHYPENCEQLVQRWVKTSVNYAEV